MHFSPLRYPGGKARLAPIIREVMIANALIDGTYVEPFSGGFGIGLSLLLRGHVSKVVINDLSPEIYSFWLSCVFDTESFCKKILNAELSVENWYKQKHIFANSSMHSVLDVGFATFFLNRTNVSGVLNGGPIGGVDQSGNYKIDARFNKSGLIDRIKMISRMKSRIELYNLDAIDLIDRTCGKLHNTLYYFDPPYFVQGGNLYYNYYKPSDHKVLLGAIESNLKK